jgi:hypothetical protein
MDEITPEWLTAALRSRGLLNSCSVTSIDKVTIGLGVGILGELCRITPTYSSAEPKAPKTLIAKIPTADPGGKGVAQMLGLYEKEARFYDELADTIGVRTPRGYFTASNPAEVKYVILMEDLGALRIGDQVAGASLDDCRLVVEQLGKLHARWWDCPELHALDWIPSINSPVIKLAALAYAQAFEPFMQKFGDHLTGQQKEFAAAYLPRMNPMQDHFAIGPQTLCHGDLRLDNVFWGSPDDSSPITLIDWQIAIKSRGPYDVAYFMSQSVDPEIRAANEESLLKDYHALLAENGVKDYAFDQCWDDYRASVMGCLNYPLVAGGSVDLANERGLELATKMLNRSLAAIMDLKAYEVLDRFEPAPLPTLG